MRRWRAVLTAPLAALTLLAAGRALPAQQYFGQNHLVYERFDWRVLETEHFLVHYYPEIGDAARMAARMAERAYARLSPVLGHEFREKKPIVLFASRTDFAQNNIFGDLGEGTGGVTDALRQRNMLFFTGEMREFEHVLMHEMVHVFQYDVISRGRAGSNLQTLQRVAPPLWFMEGMAEYLSNGPADPATNAILRDAAINGKLPTVEEMTLRPDLYFPYRYGQAFFEYIGTRWGDRSIGDVLNAAPGVGIERAFARELGTDLDELGEEWREQMQVEHLPQIAERQRVRRFSDPLLNETRTGGVAPIYVAPALSPDGRQIAYISTGSYLRAEVFLDLYLADVETGKRRQRITKSARSTETEELRILYSQAAFSPDGRLLAYTGQRRGRDVLFLHDVRRNRVVRRLDTPLEQMLGPTFAPDGRRLAFSGASGGTTDLYVIDADGGGLRRLTQDAYGDVQPAWSPDGRYLAFASERGPQSDPDVLRFGKRRIALYDLETNRVEVLPGQDGMNSNPQWAPDGRSLAYVSDRTGTQNVFLYDLETREHYQLTDVFGSVLSWTASSPSISWAREADKLAFTFYEDGNYAIRSIDRPRQLKGEPFRAPAGAAAPVVADGAPGPRGAPAAAFLAGPLPPGSAPAPAADSATSAATLAIAALDSLRRATQGPPTRQSLVLDEDGLRPADRLPTRLASTAEPLTVRALLDSAGLALPDTAGFRDYGYAAALAPEAVARPSIGYAQDNFGSGVFGGTAMLLSDMLGNHRLALSAALNGRVSESQLYASYMNMSNRLQYMVGGSQTPFFLLTGASTVQDPSDPDSPLFLDEQVISRYVFRDAFASAFYPLDRFTRLETGLRVSNIGVTDLYIGRSVNAGSGAVSPYFVDSIVAGPAVTMAAPYVAYVRDDALLGFVGPIMGKRLRVQLSPTVGSWRWTELLVDARRYDPILFNFLTVATRFVTSARVGRDEARFPQVLGRPDFIRGYDREFFFNSPCRPGLGQSPAAGCGSVQELIGSRVAFANAELRFPLVRRLDLGLLPISLPPVEGAVFYDAGVAWNRGQSVRLSRSPSGDPAQRHLLTSYGVSVRANVFGFAIMRWDYAIPLNRDSRGGYWRWTVGPAF